MSWRQKMSQAAEATAQSEARKNAQEHMEAKAQDHEAWEIAAKAFGQVEQRGARAQVG